MSVRLFRCSDHLHDVSSSVDVVTTCTMSVRLCGCSDHMLRCNLLDLNTCSLSVHMQQHSEESNCSKFGRYEYFLHLQHSFALSHGKHEDFLHSQHPFASHIIHDQKLASLFYVCIPLIGNQRWSWPALVSFVRSNYTYIFSTARGSAWVWTFAVAIGFRMNVYRSDQLKNERLPQRSA